MTVYLPDLHDDVVVLALTCWGEARGGGIPGMQSVANVVMNRVNHPRWWGTTIRTVCLCTGQFDCWNQNGPNYDKMIHLSLDNQNYLIALGVAYLAKTGVLPNITMNSDSYYALSMSTPPYWAAPPATHVVDIAGQSFWRTELLPLPTNDGEA